MRAIVRRIAELAHTDRLPALVDLVRADGELDAETRRWILRIAGNEPFLRDAEEHLSPNEPSLQSRLAGAISSVG